MTAGTPGEPSEAAGERALPTARDEVCPAAGLRGAEEPRGDPQTSYSILTDRPDTLFEPRTTLNFCLSFPLMSILSPEASTL